MRMSVVGNSQPSRSFTSCSSPPFEGAVACSERPFATRRLPRSCREVGFTILELLVVVAIIAFATAGVSLSLRDSSQTQLEREAQRLATLFESARAQSRANGSEVVWRVTAEGFRFEGLPPGALPGQWLSGDVAVLPGAAIQLGPEPIIGAQGVELGSLSQPGRSLRVVTDGLRPFTVQPVGDQ